MSSKPYPPIAKRRGLMFVLSSPSGAGKTTLSRRLLESEEGVAMSVSVTTRAPRPGEVDGQDYFFHRDTLLFEIKQQRAFQLDMDIHVIFIQHHIAVKTDIGGNMIGKTAYGEIGITPTPTDLLIIEQQCGVIDFQTGDIE